MQRHLRLGIPVLLATACSSDPFGPAEERALAAAEERWQAAGPESYTFEYRVSCFCESRGWMRIAVEDGVVAAVVYADSAHVAVEPDEWPTVDDLFARIRELADGGSHHGRDVSAAFDATLGYPTDIDVTYDSSVQDAGVSYSARNLTPVP